MDYELLIGTPPAWLELGPVVLRDGVPLREVLGDWSDRDECDRPPKYFVEQDPTTVVVRKGELGPVAQVLPGKPISTFKGVHSGKVALLFNGPSLAKHDLFRIKVPIIGMNRTYVGHKGYEGPDPDYLCAIDDVWIHEKDVAKHPRLINGSVVKTDLGYRVTRSFRATPFSFDLAHDGYVPLIPGTTGFLALQLAAYMGFEEIYCLGLDLGGSHFDNSTGSAHYKWMNRHFSRMAPVIKERGFKVFTCGNPDSHCTAFDHAPFEAVC